AKIFFSSVGNVRYVNGDIDDLINKKVDAVVSDKFVNIVGAKVYNLSTLGFKFNRYYFVATKGYIKNHKKEIEFLLSSIDGSVNISPFLIGMYYNKKVSVSKEFEAYFKTIITKKLKAALTPYWPPFNVEIDGKLQGIVVDMWKLIAKNAHINYDLIADPVWANVLKGLKEGRYDVIPGTSKTPDREKYAIFSKPYMEFPFGIACRDDINVKSIKDIKAMAVGYNYTAHKVMKLHYPNMHFVPAKSVLDAFKLVEQGKAQCVVDMLPIVVWIINQNHIGSINVYFKTKFKYKLRVMLRKDLKDLRDKIDVAIDKISVFEKNKIIAKYLGEGYFAIHYPIKLILTLLAFFLGVIGIVGYKVYEYKSKAQKDLLTGIYNRGTIESLLKHQMKKGKGSVIFFDIDHFKKINDTYGHDKGDVVLKKLVKIIKQNIRESDLFGRWGGEEFLIVLPNTSYEKALKKAEMLREIVAHSDLGGIKATISLGVSEYNKGDDLDEVIKKADEALYEAKESGRNRVKGKR
ncbi:MAG: diguanylate cyclase, partial [Epsilonproteobacteria bacterium]|nr:diguanylate cyclase [Campylobacterota bacterium]